MLENKTEQNEHLWSAGENANGKIVVSTRFLYSADI